MDPINIFPPTKNSTPESSGISFPITDIVNNEENALSSSRTTAKKSSPLQQKQCWRTCVAFLVNLLTQNTGSASAAPSCFSWE